MRLGIITLLLALLLAAPIACASDAIDLNPAPTPEAELPAQLPPLSPSALEEALPFNANCGALLLAEQQSGQIIFAMNPDSPRPVASVTKVMTILLALEMLDADKIFTFDLMGTMFTIAKDVKLQIVFNPEKIAKYRLVGYENRVMANHDFDDDTKDAGEIGAGHRVTAFYEVFLTAKEEVETEEPAENSDENNETGEPAETEGSENTEEAEVNFGEDDFLLLKMRYKEPDADNSKYMDVFMTSENIPEKMSQNMGFASSVAEFGMLLRDSKFKADSSYDSVLKRAQENIGKDTFGLRGEFLELVEIAKDLDR